MNLLLILDQNSRWCKCKPPPAMEFPATDKPRALLLFTLTSLLFLAHAKLDLDRSDYNAFYTIYKDLGNANGQRHAIEPNPCNLAGVYCGRRITNNGTAVLRITRIVFKSKWLTGFFSPVIGRLTELRELSLPNNYLVDQIPPQIVDCKKLEILNLQNNGFSGEITSELSSLIRLRILDLSSNKFSGNLSFLKYFPNLENLSLNNNKFSGKIPTSVRSFRYLQFFNFSGNDQLQGTVPLATRIELSTAELPKRYKFAENTIAMSPLTAIAPSASKYEEDAESPTAENTIGMSPSMSPSMSPAIAPSASRDEADAESPTASVTPQTHKKNTGKKIRKWILGFLAGSVAGCISGMICSLLFKLLLAIVKGGKHKSGLEIFSQSIKKKDLAFLEKEDGLASLQIIGRGGCGDVYKAELSDCTIKTIAIKKVMQPPMNAESLAEGDTKDFGKKMRQIRSEIKTVGKIRHRNLLSLLAHLCRPDCHYLVYEFMKNGSLQDALNEVSRGNKELDWLSRHKIALGISSGLEYLHTSQSPRIIHRDLKPANILIDDYMEARIADFGLAKAVPDANTHMTTSHVAGTVGYIAPEYHQTLKFTDKCDIYSFGVLLGVLVIGRQPSDEFFQHTNEMSLVKWMRRVMTSETPSEAIDSKLMGNGYEEQMLLVLKIACFCTLDDPKQRPNSKDVRCMLSQIMH